MPSEVKHPINERITDIIIGIPKFSSQSHNFSNEPPILSNSIGKAKTPTFFEESENLNEAIVSLESAVSSLTAQGPLSSSFSADVCGALADVYFEARFPE